MRRIDASVCVAGLLAVAVVVMSGSVAAAALHKPPIEFTLSPPTVDRGRALTIRIAPMPHSEWTSSGPLDVYLMWATTERAAFLRPDGAWSPTPVALRRGMEPGSPMIVMEWNPHPPGEVPLALVAVPTGADPLFRSNWRFRPVLRSARVAGPPVRFAIDVATAVPLLAATVLAIGVVAVVPRSRR
jgi:hypothetical protein